MFRTALQVLSCNPAGSNHQTTPLLIRSAHPSHPAASWLMQETSGLRGLQEVPSVSHAVWLLLGSDLCSTVTLAFSVPSCLAFKLLRGSPPWRPLKRVPHCPGGVCALAVAEQHIRGKQQILQFRALHSHISW